MPNARRGEVWLVDLGMTAKVRPAVIFNTPFRDNERALFTIVPHTTALRGGRFEVVINVPWLENGAFDVQGLRPIPGSVLVRRLGALNQSQMETLLQAVKVWMEIP
ncbi:MAG TPA: type II toxin-antitoxin system PemK/MazF family toxin [Candidatus Limnocylindrales bacterium]|nr:type II toxin-antitoxin system PemK/MazF family toxin [Candidatus Limnocylindrales bacterium]